jgi:hypothetical protein
MAGALSDDDWRGLSAAIRRVLPVRDTSTQRQELARLARTYRRLDDAGRASFLRQVASDLGSIRSGPGPRPSGCSPNPATPPPRWRCAGR